MKRRRPGGLEAAAAPSAAMHYRSWAAACYEARIAPLLAALPDRAQPLARDWRGSCAPGRDPATRARLFPGAQFLLWADALAGPGASAGGEPMAAAIEALHNATLVHDDVIDGHALRRGQPTLLGIRGSAAALLAGDGLQADALELLARLDPPPSSACLRALGRALREVALGQWLDEPENWARVPAARRLAHWRRVCRLKLAIGNVGAPLAACWLGTARLGTDAGELAARIEALLRGFSVVSQIINDLGDWYDFAGLHAPSPSGRARFEESARKPTLPVLWRAAPGDAPATLATAGASLAATREALLARGRAEIDTRRRRALRALDALPLARPLPPALPDFFQSPALPGAGR
ncbi:MAG: polyprenyl synthetase family protein [Burkholderiales bacterium]|nr:polyprenyl synthetase family protein [Burkholderiales bacterium]